MTHAIHKGHTNKRVENEHAIAGFHIQSGPRVTRGGGAARAPLARQGKLQLAAFDEHVRAGDSLQGGLRGFDVDLYQLLEVQWWGRELARGTKYHGRLRSACNWEHSMQRCGGIPVLKCAQYRCVCCPGALHRHQCCRWRARHDEAGRSRGTFHRKCPLWQPTIRRAAAREARLG